jgi:hypothetical protein
MRIVAENHFFEIFRKIALNLSRINVYGPPPLNVVRSQEGGNHLSCIISAFFHFLFSID